MHFLLSLFKNKKLLISGLIIFILGLIIFFSLQIVKSPANSNTQTLGLTQTVKTWDFDLSTQNWYVGPTSKVNVENGLLLFHINQINVIPYLINTQVNAQLPYNRKYLTIRMALEKDYNINNPPSQIATNSQSFRISYRINGSNYWSKPLYYRAFLKPTLITFRVSLPETYKLNMIALKIEFTSGFDSNDIIKIDSIKLLNENTSISPTQYRRTPTAYPYRPSPVPSRFYPTTTKFPYYPSPTRYYYPSPTRYYYPSPTRYQYYPSPTRYYYYPSPTRYQYYPSPTRYYPPPTNIPN